MNRTIVIIGEDPGIAKARSTPGFRLVQIELNDDGLSEARRYVPSLVVVNLNGATGAPGFLSDLGRAPSPVVVLTDPALVESAAIENGKVRVLVPPVPEADLHATIRELLEQDPHRARPETPHPRDIYVHEYAPLLGHSEPMRAVQHVIEKVADTSATVLIRGESGVGKELVARAIHYASLRRAQPFVKVNCAALPAELLESELFGHERGAFTGAYRRKPGKFEFANRGTLFLDEVGELPLALQAKLLHVLQDQEFSRLGGREVIRVDARVVASTNLDLEKALHDGRFREDLYYRLNVVEIRVPPLRERPDEVPVLARYFLEAFERQYDRTAGLPIDLLQAFGDYPWPGNVRELQNVVRRLVVLGNAHQVLQDIRARLETSRLRRSPDPPRSDRPQPGTEAPIGLKEIARRAAREAERKAILEILERVRWNRAEAARVLKISYKSLLAKIDDCGLGSGERKRTRQAP